MMTEENFVSDVVDKLKKQGLFDRFRKECLADVDTKPAYQNLQVRVKEAVGKHLHVLKWKADLNKNQLRESLRKHLNELPMLTNGIDRVVDQVVKPKIMKSQIDRVVCEHMGVDYERWLNDQSDAQKKKLIKTEENNLTAVSSALNVLPSQCSTVITPSFPPDVTVAPPMAPIAVPTSLSLKPATPFNTAINDLQLPPPPPPPPPASKEELSDSERLAQSAAPPLPPSDDLTVDEISIPIPAPPPDAEFDRSNSPPPLPPEEDEDKMEEEELPDEQTGIDADVVDPMVTCSMEGIEIVSAGTLESSQCATVQVDGDVNAEACNEATACAESTARRESTDERRRHDSTSQMSDERSLDESLFSNGNRSPVLNADLENVQGTSKEYRFAWDDFNESDLSNVSVSSVHTSDLSSFDEDDDMDCTYDPGHSRDNAEHNSASNGPHTHKFSDPRGSAFGVQTSPVKKSFTDSILENLDTSNASGASSSRKKMKKEEMKEKKMEEKKMELKRRRILNRKYCSEEFTSIFTTKKNLLEDKVTPEKREVKAVSPANQEKQSDSKQGYDEESILHAEEVGSDAPQSPYSNISEASSDSVVVVGVEPAKPKKGKKSKGRKRSRSSDGSRRKKKKRRHKSNRRTSHRCSGRETGEDDHDNAKNEFNDNDGIVVGDKFVKHRQQRIRTKSSSSLHDLESSSRSRPEEELMIDDYDEGDELSNNAVSRMTSKKSVDEINFGEAERQAAALRMHGSNKQTTATGTIWQKQTFAASSRPARALLHHYAPPPNFLPSPLLPIHRHPPSNYPQLITPPYHHPAPVAHSPHDSRGYEQNRAEGQNFSSSKYGSDINRYRIPRNSTKRSYNVDAEDEMKTECPDSSRHRRSRQEVQTKQFAANSHALKHNSAEEFNECSRQDKRQYDISERRGKK